MDAQWEDFGASRKLGVHHFYVDIPMNRWKDIGIYEDFGYSKDIVCQCLISRNLWVEIKNTVRKEFNTRLKQESIEPLGRWHSGRVKLRRDFGQELCVLSWGLENAGSDEIEYIVQRWLALSPLDRHYLFSKASQGITENNGNWRKALYFMLANPDDEFAQEQDRVKTLNAKVENAVSKATTSTGMLTYTVSFKNLEPKSCTDVVQKLFKYKTEFVHNTLGNINYLELSLSDVDTLLQGKGLADVSMIDMLRIRDFQHALEDMLYQICTDAFIVDRYTLFNLHKTLMANDNIQNKGIFRKNSIKSENRNWIPPEPKLLPKYWRESVLPCLAKKNVLEAALTTFCTLCRACFFQTGNRKTALLFVNGILLSNGYDSLCFSPEQSHKFDKLFSVFCEDGDADEILTFLQNMYIKNLEVWK